MQTFKIPSRLVRDNRLYLPAALGGFEMVLPLSWLNDLGAAELVSVELSGGWEIEERCWLRDTLRPGDCFVDVGAHFGIMTLEAAALGVRTVAVEPHPDNLRALRAWIAHNGVADRVRVVAAAATGRPGPVWLRTNTSMGHHVAREAPTRAEHDALWESGPLAGSRQWLETEGRPLAEILADEPGRIVVKLDVEGSEIDVLKGATPLLEAGRISHVLWEQGEGDKRNADHAEIVAFLSGYGLRTRDVTPVNAVSALPQGSGGG